MKTWEETKNEWAKEQGWENWEHFEEKAPISAIREVYGWCARLYAQAALDEAKRNVRLKTTYSKRVNGKMVNEDPIYSQTARLQSNALVEVDKDSLNVTLE